MLRKGFFYGISYKRAFYITPVDKKILPATAASGNLGLSYEAAYYPI
jgi:hypothetical protein